MTTRCSCTGFVPWLMGAAALLAACGLSSEPGPAPGTTATLTRTEAAQLAAADDGEPLLDPIPEDPTPSELALTIKEFAQFPKSEPFPPTTDARLVRWARINFLGELPDGSHRMYTPDLNGTLYFLKNG